MRNYKMEMMELSLANDYAGIAKLKELQEKEETQTISTIVTKKINNAHRLIGLGDTKTTPVIRTTSTPVAKVEQKISPITSPIVTPVMNSTMNGKELLTKIIDGLSDAIANTTDISILLKLKETVKDLNIVRLNWEDSFEDMLSSLEVSKENMEGLLALSSGLGKTVAMKVIAPFIDKVLEDSRGINGYTGSTALTRLIKYASEKGFKLSYLYDHNSITELITYIVSDGGKFNTSNTDPKGRVNKLVRGSVK